MANLGSLVASMGVDTIGLRGDLSRAQRMFRSSAGRITSSLTRIKRSIFSLRGAMAGLGVGLLAKSFIQAASTTENLNITLVQLLGSVKEGNGLFQDMTKFASSVPFEFEEIMNSATMLAGVMKGGRKEIGTWIPLIADLAATYKGMGMTMQNTTEQIVRMYSAGAASADMFREKGITAALGFQAGVTTSAEETRERLMSEWNKTGSFFKGTAKKLATTWSGQLSMMADAWFQFRVRVMNAAPFQALKASFKVLLDYIKGKQGGLDKFADELGVKILEVAKRVAMGIAKFVDQVSPIVSGISNALAGMWNVFAGLPTWVQEIGVVGAFALGRKGKMLLLGALFIMDKNKEAIDDYVTRWRAISAIRDLIGKGLIEPTEELEKKLRMSSNEATKFVESLIEIGMVGEDILSGMVNPDQFSFLDLIPIDAGTEAQDRVREVMEKIQEEMQEMEALGAENKAIIQEDRILAEIEQLEREWDEKNNVVDNALNRRLITVHEYHDRLAKVDKKAAADAKKKQDLVDSLKIKSALMTANILLTIGMAIGEKGKEIVRAARISEAIINTYAGATRALSDYPYPYSKIIAGLVVAQGFANIALIASAKTGADFIPSDQPVNLHKGEGVLTSENNKSFKNFLVSQDEMRKEAEAGISVADEEKETPTFIINLDGHELMRALAENQAEAKEDKYYFG